MTFWILMLAANLLVPLLMIVFGRISMKRPPKKINGFYGYRTAMSMKNQETWEFAHKHSGKIWFTCGCVALPATVLLMLLALGKPMEFVAVFAVVVLSAQVILLITSIFPTEIALRKRFDQNGNPK